MAAAWDSLTALEQWVEAGRPPVNPTVADLNHARTRPLCEHPSRPRYVAGNPDDAASVTCASAQQPAA
ncbi:tannase/feruloyl esterase family alpha/beta hydrolase [Saccharopolyspora endophytica]|uniref:tannase/feruloyl esterase family alpha/beta hydrolase n=1 Tax=Saccharopolyspora endophytica TaxID=543886 RepID=UPI001FEA625B|nr:tannase/feruloyl esterase family alpha/beta hydrolase [Saccharopolyspora endophytica]